MMLPSLQVPSVHYNPSCDRVCTWCWRE